MAAQNASLGTSGHPSKSARTHRGRDGREAAHYDDSTVTANNPPNHGLPTNGPARFLWDVPADTPVDELGDLWERWNDDTEQVDLSEVKSE